jgi:hypothetical protein
MFRIAIPIIGLLLIAFAVIRQPMRIWADTVYAAVTPTPAPSGSGVPTPIPTPTPIPSVRSAELVDTTAAHTHVGRVDMARSRNDLILTYTFDNPASCTAVRIAGNVTQTTSDMDGLLGGPSPQYGFDKSFSPGIRYAVIPLRADYNLGGSEERFVSTHVWFDCGNGSKPEADIRPSGAGRGAFFSFVPEATAPKPVMGTVDGLIRTDRGLVDP